MFNCLAYPENFSRQLKRVFTFEKTVRKKLPILGVLNAFSRLLNKSIKNLRIVNGLGLINDFYCKFQKNEKIILFYKK